MRLVHAIADYGPGDLAFSEMISALARHLPDDVRWHPTPVESFNTLATGFIVGQLGLVQESVPTVIYANCAPRQDKTEARDDNEGEGLLYGKLRNGVQLLVVNSGLSLSFVREHLSELYATEVPEGGSQFRSRDVFPPFVGKVFREDLSFLKRPIDPLKIIPEVPAARIGYVDSFGNLKTTFRDGDPELEGLKPGQRLDLMINGIQRTVTVQTGSFHVRQGDIAFAPGSSGFERRFWEVFQRGGSASITYGNPRVGALVEMSR